MMFDLTAKFLAHEAKEKKTGLLEEADCQQ